MGILATPPILSELIMDNCVYWTGVFSGDSFVIIVTCSTVVLFKSTVNVVTQATVVPCQAMVVIVT